MPDRALAHAEMPLSVVTCTLWPSTPWAETGHLGDRLRRALCTAGHRLQRLGIWPEAIPFLDPRDRGEPRWTLNLMNAVAEGSTSFSLEHPLRFDLGIAGPLPPRAALYALLRYVGEKGLTRAQIPHEAEPVRLAGRPVSCWTPERAADRLSRHPAGPRIRIRLASPLSLRGRGARTLAPAAELFPRLAEDRWRAVERTLGLDPVPPFRHPRGLRLCAANTRWVPILVRGLRNRTPVDRSGIVGELELEAEEWGDFPDLLALAPVLHWGRGRTMGHGRVERLPDAD